MHRAVSEQRNSEMRATSKLTVFKCERLVKIGNTDDPLAGPALSQRPRLNLAPALFMSTTDLIGHFVGIRAAIGAAVLRSTAAMRCSQRSVIFKRNPIAETDMSS